MHKSGINYSTEELVLVLPAGEYYNEDTGEFFSEKEHVLRLKHSLLSISKWEAKYERPFLDDKRKMTLSETLDYIRFMTITQNVDPGVYKRLNNNHYLLVKDYINAKMCGTNVYDEKGHKGEYQKKISAELIYYWMTEFNIPWEAQKWHLSRLLMLIRVCGIKKAQANSPKGKKTGKGRDYRSINNARKKRHKTKG